MARRKRIFYARTYLLQTDGSAAIKAPEAVNALDTKEQTATEKRPFMLELPVWGALLAAAAGVFLVAILLLNMSSSAAQIQKSIYDLRQSERRAREIMEALEVEIARAEAPEIIHSKAVNQLGMRRPTENEIVYIPYAGNYAPENAEEPLPESEGSIWRYLFGLLGF